MSSTKSTPERSRSIPPPPPPIEEDLSVEYGSMANTYSNNHMADDESVEAQHVVYTFAEESKSSKKGRKKCILLMLASIVLFSVIVALGVVYGTQRKGRNNGTIAEANSSETNQETSDGANTELDEDIYDSPNFADSNSTDFEDDTLDEDEDEDEDEDLSAGNEIIVAPDSTNTTTPPTNSTIPTIPDAGTPAPTIVNTGTVTTATTWTSSTATSTTGTVGQGGFQQRPNQNVNQGQAGAQGGFQGGAGAQGGFQQRPNQNGNQGGAGGQGGFQGGAGAQGGFQQRPNQVGFQGGVGNNGQVGRESDNVFGV